MTEISWISLFIMLSALKGTCSVVIPDPEFDDDYNWLQGRRSIIMMKKLPANAKYTWKEYYKSWNLNYDLEMSKKELSFATVEYIEKKLNSLNHLKFENVIVVFDVSLKSCENDNGMMTYDMRITSEEKFDRIDWRAKYCGSETVQEWCSTGDRLLIKMSGINICANVTFTCPFSLYHLVADLLIVETRTSWRFSRFFYITIGIICAALLLTVGVLAVVACERQHRKISRMAHAAWRNSFRYTEDNASFGVLDDEYNVESHCSVDSPTDEMEPPPTVDT